MPRHACSLSRPILRVLLRCKAQETGLLDHSKTNMLSQAIKGLWLQSQPAATTAAFKINWVILKKVKKVVTVADLIILRTQPKRTSSTLVATFSFTRST